MYLFIYQIFIRNIFIKNLPGYISDNFLCIMIYIYDSLSYIVYRKEQSKTWGKSREKIGREYDQINQIIKKNCYL